MGVIFGRVHGHCPEERREGGDQAGTGVDAADDAGIMAVSYEYMIVSLLRTRRIYVDFHIITD